MKQNQCFKEWNKTNVAWNESKPIRLIRLLNVVVGIDEYNVVDNGQTQK